MLGEPTEFSLEENSSFSSFALRGANTSTYRDLQNNLETFQEFLCSIPELKVYLTGYG